jgi:hypothetical protein
LQGWPVPENTPGHILLFNGVVLAWPMSSPLPQQYAAPAVVMPHVWLIPTLIAENVSPPDTSVGASELLMVEAPLPS